MNEEPENTVVEKSQKETNYESARAYILRNYYEHSYENRYGSIDDGAVDFHNYVCHAKLNKSDTMTEIFVSCIYWAHESWSLDDQAMYFEYILDPRTSPWHEIIPDLDLDVIRLNGRPHVVVVKNIDYNRYLLFSFLKGFRQIYERQFAMKLFTDYLKSISEEERLSRDTYRYFLLTHLFKGVQTLIPCWGGDHHVFHGTPTQALIDRKIVGFDKKRGTCSYQEGSRYYFNQDLYDYVWGQKGNPSHFVVREISDLFKGEVSYGNIFDRPTSTSSSSRPYADVYKGFPAFIEKYQEKYGKIEFTQEEKEKAA